MNVKKVIPIIKQGDSGLLKELDTLISVLEDKRKRIDGMINHIKVLKEIPGMPRVVQRALLVFFSQGVLFLSLHQ